MAESDVSGTPKLVESQTTTNQPLAQATTTNTQPDAVPSGSQLDQLRVNEALLARDNAIYHMEKVCASNRTKDSTIAKLQQEKENLEMKLGSASTLGRTELEDIHLKDADNLRKANAELTAKLQALSLSPQPSAAMPSPLVPPDALNDTPKLGHAPAEAANSITQARYASLAELPIPEDMPNDTLVPIIIPTPFTLQDFLGTVAEPMRAHLTNYRVFQETTTSCTNPRVATAHRWNAVDVGAELDKSSECFFNKDGKWYYAGIYKTFRLSDIATAEWTALPVETTQSIIKETIQLRKNVSPQNVYEIGQLYAAGALKAACIGLQCVGFNNGLYDTLLEQANLCAKTGRWRGPPAEPGVSGL